MKNLLIFISFFITLDAIEIKQLAIIFDKTRIDLTKEYIQKRYNLDVNNINIIPRFIVVHHTSENSLNKSYLRFKPEVLLSDRKYISKQSTLNVSAHFLVDKDGTIYSLMPETYMARHTIGLNYSSIAIENIGGENKNDKLTKQQLEANIKLVNYLKDKYKTIEYLIAHYEYTKYENNKYWLEIDKNYKTIKHDPSKIFMNKLKKSVKGLKTISD